MDNGDYYRILGVPRSASADEIKTAYRNFAMRFHPDVTQNDPVKTDRFKEGNEAYYTLSDETKRREYDRQNPDAVVHREHNRSENSRNYETRGRHKNFGDLIRLSIELSFEQWARGTNMRLEFIRDGKNAAEEVAIPAGWDCGNILSFEGLGHRNRANRPGDLSIHIMGIKADPYYFYPGLESGLYAGLNVYSEIEVNLFELLLDVGKINIRTLDGAKMLDLPSWSGNELILKGCGIHRMTKDKKGIETVEKGDHILTLTPAVPPDLTEEDRQILQRMAIRYSKNVA